MVVNLLVRSDGHALVSREFLRWRSRNGIIKPSVWMTYALADAAEAHAALEGGASAGAILLKLSPAA